LKFAKRELIKINIMKQLVGHKPIHYAVFTPKSVRDILLLKYADTMEINPELNRALVSFQSNKKKPFYRWYKYKEAFSAELVNYLLDKFGIKYRSTKRILDPFAGAGTTLLAAATRGWQATGIELLPIGIEVVKAHLNAHKVDILSFEKYCNIFLNYQPKNINMGDYKFPHLRITQNAFSQNTEISLSQYDDFLKIIRNPEVRDIFKFASLAVLEDISYTRKDGQYLRWDNKSGRSLKSNFSKGQITEFKKAILQKLNIMAEDIKSKDSNQYREKVQIIAGSCLDRLPKFADNSFELVITSPPYCNRYDYTRTYALELAYLGIGETGIKNLRQTMLSCTVENKSKRNLLADEYNKRNNLSRFENICGVFDEQLALREILDSLKSARNQGRLNNNNIPNLVENYFFEMNLVIHELYRVLSNGGKVLMVNDNVQYNGEEIPVDLILSDFASQAGFTVSNIWILPRGKGNSSQQMGIFGRNEIRKCVYVWTK
jgi:DNA modification methylase